MCGSCHYYLKGIGQVTLEEEHSKKDLMDMCRERKLSTSGNKDELVKRLLKWKKSPEEGNQERALVPTNSRKRSFYGEDDFEISKTYTIQKKGPKLTKKTTQVCSKRGSRVTEIAEEVFDQRTGRSEKTRKRHEINYPMKKARYQIGWKNVFESSDESDYDQ